MNEDIINNLQVVKEASQSQNGFVDFLSRTSNGDVEYVMKTSIKSTSDNLIYEYFVGWYLNKLNYFNANSAETTPMFKRFRCFTRTYALFQYKKGTTHDNIVVGTQLSNYMNVKTSSNFNLTEACTKPTSFALLLEYEKGYTLHDTIANFRTHQFYLLNLMEVLLQIYVPLMILEKEYTHYDLHTLNVLVFKNDKPVLFTFFDPVDPSKELISFKSYFTCKIIDYGRCFFADTNDVKLSSTYVRERVCKIKECGKNCGRNLGFSFLLDPLEQENKAFTEKAYYINSSRANKSHDLKLVYLIKKQLQKLDDLSSWPEFRAFFYNVRYDSQYGTPPRDSDGSSRINNVTDAANYLIRIYKEKQNFFVNQSRRAAEKQTQHAEIQARRNQSQIRSPPKALIGNREEREKQKMERLKKAMQDRKK